MNRDRGAFILCKEKLSGRLVAPGPVPISSFIPPQPSEPASEFLIFLEIKVTG
jgi:hypothetical protein